MKRLIIAAALCLGTANAAAAQEGFYFGLGVGATSGKSQAEFGGTSKDTYGALGGVVGYRWESTGFFFGAELDGEAALGSKYAYAGVPCALGANGPYYCEHTGTLRLRGVVGGSLNANYEGFATLGGAAMSGKGAINPGGLTDKGINTGYTVGLGIQRGLNSGAKIRAEVIYDKLDSTRTKPNGLYVPKYQGTSLKVTYIFPM
jgi:opacity protein-like surface antigen